MTENPTDRFVEAMRAMWKWHEHPCEPSGRYIGDVLRRAAEAFVDAAHVPRVDGICIIDNDKVYSRPHVDCRALLLRRILTAP